MKTVYMWSAVRNSSRGPYSRRVPADAIVRRAVRPISTDQHDAWRRPSCPRTARPTHVSPSGARPARKSHAEGGSLGPCRTDLRGAAVRLGDLVHDEQAKADAPGSAGGVGATGHRLEDAGLDVLGDGGAVIMNSHADGLFIRTRGHGYRALRGTVG